MQSTGIRAFMRARRQAQQQAGTRSWMPGVMACRQLSLGAQETVSPCSVKMLTCVHAVL